MGVSNTRFNLTLRISRKCRLSKCYVHTPLAWIFRRRKMKLKKLTALLLAFATSVCAFSQVNLKNMSAEELIDLKANIEKELFARKPEAFTAAKNPLEGLSFSRNVSGWSTYTETLTFGSNGTLVYRKEWSNGPRSEVYRVSYSVDTENRLYSVKKDDMVAWFGYGSLYIDFDGGVFAKAGTKFSLQDAKSIAGNTYVITEEGVDVSVTFNKDGTFTEKKENESHTSAYLVDADEKIILCAGNEGWKKLRYTEDALTIGIGGKEAKKR